jgi:hypothetical protein
MESLSQITGRKIFEDLKFIKISHESEREARHRAVLIALMTHNFLKGA